MTLGAKSSGLREAQRLAVGIAWSLIRWKKRQVTGLDFSAYPFEAWGVLLPQGFSVRFRLATLQRKCWMFGVGLFGGRARERRCYNDQGLKIHFGLGCSTN